MTSLRWRMMTLLMIGSIINYLTRSTLGVAAPSSAWRARTCPAQAIPLTSTGSSTSSGRTASIR